MLILVPFFVQQVSKQFIVVPILDHFRGGEVVQVFLNDEMKEEAFRELQTFEESLKFEALISPSSPTLEESDQPHTEKESSTTSAEKEPNSPAAEPGSNQPAIEKGSPSPAEPGSNQPAIENKGSSPPAELAPTQPLSEEAREKLVKQKAIEIAEEFRQKSKDAMGNVFADAIALGAFVLILVLNREAIVVLQSFTNNVVQGLSDSAKAFVIILLTDIFVGFHSPHGWEVLLEGVAGHLGIPANRTGIFLFIATIPVILDTMFKYWLFRYLSRMAPSTLATYKEMND
jgi:hypothetical protein